VILGCGDHSGDVTFTTEAAGMVELDAGFWICIDFMRIRIQGFNFEILADPDPDLGLDFFLQNIVYSTLKKKKRT